MNSKLYAYTTTASGERIDLEGESLEELAKELEETGVYDARVIVRDEHGFARGWIDGYGGYSYSTKYLDWPVRTVDLGHGVNDDPKTYVDTRVNDND